MRATSQSRTSSCVQAIQVSPVEAACRPAAACKMDSVIPQSFLAFPVELWILIVRALLAADCPLSSVDVLHLSWTCRTAYAAAQPFIWRNLTLVLGAGPPFPGTHTAHCDYSFNPLSTIFFEADCTTLGKVCKSPHTILNGRVYFVGTSNKPCRFLDDAPLIDPHGFDCVEPAVTLYPWPVRWTRQVVLHDHGSAAGFSPDTHAAVTRFLKSLSSWLGNRIQSVQVHSYGRCMFDVAYGEFFQTFKPNPLGPTHAHGTQLARPFPVSRSLALSSTDVASRTLRHTLPVLVTLVTNLRLVGSFDFIFNEWHGWLASITRLFSNTILSTLVLHLRLPLKQWMFHQSHQFPIHMPSLTSLSLSVDAAIPLFAHLSRLNGSNPALPLLARLELSDQYSTHGSDSDDVHRIPCFPFMHMPSLVHVHVHKHRPTSSHALHMSHLVGFAQCAKLQSLRLPAVKQMHMAAGWAPQVHPTIPLEMEPLPVLPRLPELEVCALSPVVDAPGQNTAFDWMPSLRKATKLVYHCQCDCTLPGMDAELPVSLDGPVYPHLLSLAVHAPQGVVSYSFLSRIAVLAPNVVTLCLFAQSLDMDRHSAQAQGRLPLSLRLLALQLGCTDGGRFHEWLGRLQVPEACRVRVSLGAGEQALCNLS